MRIIMLLQNNISDYDISVFTKDEEDKILMVINMYYKTKKCLCACDDNKKNMTTTSIYFDKIISKNEIEKLLNDFSNDINKHILKKKYK